MLPITDPPATTAVTDEHPLATADRHLARYGLAVVIAWIGALKYTTYEAAAIQPLIAHSPISSCIYEIVSVRAFAAMLGTLEIIAALLIATRPLAPRLSAAGSAMGVLLSAWHAELPVHHAGSDSGRRGARCCRCCRASSCSKTSCWPALRCGPWATRSAPQPRGVPRAAAGSAGNGPPGGPTAVSETAGHRAATGAAAQSRVPDGGGR